MDENFEIFLYIIFAVIALLSRVFSKKNKRPAPKVNTPSETALPDQRHPTFEELLREFTGAEPATETAIEPEPEPEYAAPTPQSAYTQVSDSEAQEAYERSIREANAVRSRSQKSEPKQPRKKFDHFEHYKVEEENSQLVNFRERLNNPQGAKEAFILSEIFNRKY